MEIFMFTKGHIPSHKGKVVTTDPLKTPEAVQKVKELLSGDLRHLTLFTLAVNTAFRSGDLVNLTWDDLDDDGKSISIRVREGKTQKLRTVHLNPNASTLLRKWRAECDSPYIYSGRQGQFTTASWGRKIKFWFAECGFKGNFSGHSTRKTFARIQNSHFGTSLPVLMTMLNHSNELQTLVYIGKLNDEMEKAYSHSI
jgi:integrase